MGAISTYKEIIEAELQALSLPEQPATLYEPIRYFLQIGGKRIRPILTLMGAAAFDPTHWKKALPAALSIELFHNFTLMHDDIMDQAPLRRGWATVHEKWSVSTAILSGDALLIFAYQQLCQSPAQQLPILLNIFNSMAQEVCEGQQKDMDFEEQQLVTTQAYLDMIRQKTSVLLGAALQLGAVIGGASAEDQKLLYIFGTQVGMAFQLQDDLLDTYGDPSKFGKQVGGDILANKKTFLVLHALEKANPTDKGILLDWMTRKPQDPAAKLSAVTALFDKYDVKAATELQKNNHIQQAYEALNALSLPTEQWIPLRQLSEALLVRSN
jgi:geranylgeranyl diphosphate synthase type II